MPKDRYGSNVQNYLFEGTKMIDNVNISHVYSNTPPSETQRLSLECLQVDKLTNLLDVHEHIPV